MDLDEFNDNYLNTLLDKLSKDLINSLRKINLFSFFVFNVDLLKYDKHAPTN